MMGGDADANLDSIRLLEYIMLGMQNTQGPCVPTETSVSNTHVANNCYGTVHIAVSIL